MVDLVDAFCVLLLPVVCLHALAAVSLRVGTLAPSRLVRFTCPAPLLKLILLPKQPNIR